MNKLRPHTDIGMPYHGLATNGVLPTGHGDKTVNAETTVLGGQCIVVQNPSAPGANRSPAQQAHDTAAGLEWRDYALLTGPNHAVNGSAITLGSDSWIYCDPAGQAWIVSLAVQNNGPNATLRLRLDGIFGRIGRDYPFNARTLDSFTWSPQIPSWYTGSITDTDIVGTMSFTGRNSICPDQSGATAWVNAFNTSETVSDAVFKETQPSKNDVTPDFDGAALVSVLYVTIAGTGDILNDGAGISGTIIEDSRFQDDLVINRTSFANASTPPSTAELISGPGLEPLDKPGPTATWTHTWSWNITGPLSGYRARTGISQEAILYKNHQGTISRFYEAYVSIDWVSSYGGSLAFNHSLQDDSAGGTLSLIFDYTVFGGVAWYCSSCTASGEWMWFREIAKYIDKEETTYNVFGNIYSYTYLDELTDDRKDYTASLPAAIYQLQFCCSDSVPPSDITTVQKYFINGIETDGPADLFHEWRHIAPNLHYLTFAYPTTSSATWEHGEYVVAINNSGVASQIYDNLTQYPARTAFPYIPNTRQLAWSYQPITEESAHGPTIIFQVHSGDTFQYV